MEKAPEGQGELRVLTSEILVGIDITVVQKPILVVSIHSESPSLPHPSNTFAGPPKVPASPSNNTLALHHWTTKWKVPYSTLLQRDVPHSDRECKIRCTYLFAKGNEEHPKNRHVVPLLFFIGPSYVLTPGPAHHQPRRRSHYRPLHPSFALRRRQTYLGHP
jgi:hypothetical protein